MSADPDLATAAVYATEPSPNSFSLSSIAADATKSALDNLVARFEELIASCDNDDPQKVQMTGFLEGARRQFLRHINYVSYKKHNCAPPWVFKRLLILHKFKVRQSVS